MEHTKYFAITTTNTITITLTLIITIIITVISRSNHTTLSEFFKKYQNLTSPQGELNLNFLKKSRVQINVKLNEKSRMITY